MKCNVFSLPCCCSCTALCTLTTLGNESALINVRQACLYTQLSNTSKWLVKPISPSKGLLGCFHTRIIWKSSKTGSISLHDAVCLGICEHSNCTLTQNKTSKPRLPWRGGLGLLPIDSWSGLFAVRTQSTQQAKQITSHSSGRELISIKTLK